MATEGTKFQLNYKLNDGTLINLLCSNSCRVRVRSCRLGNER
jgi:hypothetical protein